MQSNTAQDGRKIAPCLWFGGKVEILPDLRHRPSSIGRIGWIIRSPGDYRDGEAAVAILTIET